MVKTLMSVPPASLYLESSLTVKPYSHLHGFFSQRKKKNLQHFVQVWAHLTSLIQLPSVLYVESSQQKSWNSSWSRISRREKYPQVWIGHDSEKKPDGGQLHYISGVTVWRVFWMRAFQNDGGDTHHMAPCRRSTRAAKDGTCVWKLVPVLQISWRFAFTVWTWTPETCWRFTVDYQRTIWTSSLSAVTCSICLSFTLVNSGKLWKVKKGQCQWNGRKRLGGGVTEQRFHESWTTVCSKTGNWVVCFRVRFRTNKDTGKNCVSVDVGLTSSPTLALNRKPPSTNQFWAHLMKLFQVWSHCKPWVLTAIVQTFTLADFPWVHSGVWM